VTYLQTTAVAFLMLLPTFGLGTEVVDPPGNETGAVTTAAVADESLIEVRDGQVLLAASGDRGFKFTDFLEAAQGVLGRPINYSPLETGDRMVHFAGSPSCPQADFRDFFDGILRAYDFLAYDAGAPGSDYIVVIRLGMGDTRHNRSSLSSQIIDVARLDEQPAWRSALYTTAFMLEHLDSRATMASLQPMVNTTYESIRNAANSNAVLVTATSLDQLRQIRDLLAILDVPGPDAALDNAGRLTALEKDLDALMEEVEQLKASR
jgi:hypothetical protein